VTQRSFAWLNQFTGTGGIQGSDSAIQGIVEPLGNSLQQREFLSGNTDPSGASTQRLIEAVTLVMKRAI